MNKKEQLLLNEIQKIINKVSEREIEVNVCLTSRQLDIISQLNYFCVHKILDDIEVSRDPRKITYKANQELKLALVAMCLSVTLTSHRAKSIYNKEYFENNILVENSTTNSALITFNKIEDFIVDNAIDSELVFDWMIYRDFNSRGIATLINEKMCDFELDVYSAGGCPVYEFARFQRKYYDYKRRKQNKDKEKAQDTFRNAIVQQVASQITAQSLLKGQNPLDLVNMLFDSKDYDKALKEISKITTNDAIEQNKITYKP